MTERDGARASPNEIFLTDGASVAVRLCLHGLLRGRMDGVLVPIPQYPLYSASIALYGGTLVPYYLDEASGWAMNFANLKEAVENAKREGVMCRGLVLINPGNPTGQSLTRINLEQLIKFAHEERIVLMADEVYAVSSGRGGGEQPACSEEGQRCADLLNEIQGDEGGDGWAEV